MKLLSIIFSAVSVIVVSGCTTNTKTAAKIAEQSVTAHTGKSVRWIQSAKEDEQVQKVIESTLAQQLTVDSAVVVALLNNRGLQAELEEIGIAQAEVIQAGLLKNIELAGSWRVPDLPGVVNTEYSIAADFLDLFILPLRKKKS